jgi:hypothetical protein
VENNPINYFDPSGNTPIDIDIVDVLISGVNLVYPKNMHEEFFNRYTILNFDILLINRNKPIVDFKLPYIDLGNPKVGSNDIPWVWFQIHYPLYMNPFPGSEGEREDIFYTSFSFYSTPREGYFQWDINEKYKIIRISWEADMGLLNPWGSYDALDYYWRPNKSTHSGPIIDYYSYYVKTGCPKFEVLVGIHPELGGPVYTTDVYPNPGST